MNVDADITTATSGGIDEQLIGYVEWNATKQVGGLTAQSIQMTQLEQWSATDVGAPLTGPFAAMHNKCGTASNTDTLIDMMAIKVYTNVDVLSSHYHNLYCSGATYSNKHCA